jgi:hypothetical protein
MANPFDFSAGAILTAAELNSIGDYDESGTPDWVQGITAGNATQNLAWAQINEVVHFELEFIAGSTTSYTTDAFNWHLTNSGMPAIDTELYYYPCGTGWCRPAGASIYALNTVIISSRVYISKKYRPSNVDNERQFLYHRGL